MAKERRYGKRTVWVSLTLLVLVTILLGSTYRASQSVLVTALVAAWCVLFVVAPSVLLRRLYSKGVLSPPRARFMVMTYAGLTVYTMILAGLEIFTGAGPGSWGMTFLAAAGFLGASLTARREFA
ncbi:MAG: hypothetical protein IFK94_02270 [Acidobacteria bacterium]|uniref:Uncharacterized protein n=1 Tax=Candidatus Polarisedimenticola svalbardensis TaxID=2886004 RepID=A0A8J6XZ00_9BACT|nr:hypothetical protein [Candidatus Polarisedimenticola svalbardensis]